MSPRHFARMMESKAYRNHLDEDILDQIQPGMNAWFAFFAISGLDKAITKLFVFTPKEMSDNPVKDSQSGTDQSNTNYHF
jgi:hypothetical protein